MRVIGGLLRRRGDNEDGSIIIAMSVMLVLTVLSMGMLGLTLSEMGNVRRSQNFVGALGPADAGLSDALFRLDQLGISNPSAFCVGQSPSCTLSSVPGAPASQYTVHVVDANHVQVLSKGTINGVPHGIQADVFRDRNYPFALFGKSSATFNGNDTADICTVDTSHNSCPSGITDPSADVGSDGIISCHGGSPADHHVYYPGGSTDCVNPVAENGQYNPQDPISGSCPAPANNPPTPCLPSSPAPNACPGSGTIPATVAPGQYLCTGNVTFPSTFTVGSGSDNNGVVEIFVVPTSGTANITMSGSDINLGGDPTKLRVYMAGAGQVIPGNGSHAGTFTGIMYAPSSNMTSDGCKVIWRGAVVFNTATCNGGPHLQVLYDIRIAALVASNWTVRNYTEIPSNQVVLP